MRLVSYPHSFVVDRDWDGWFPIVGASWVGAFVGVACGVGLRLIRSRLKRESERPAAAEGRPHEILMALSAGLLVTMVSTQTLEVIRVGVMRPGEDRGSAAVAYVLVPACVLLGGIAVALPKLEWERAKRMYWLAMGLTGVVAVVTMTWFQSRALELGPSWYSEAQASLYTMAWLGGLVCVASTIVAHRATREGDGPTWVLSLVVLSQAWNLAEHGLLVRSISDIEWPHSKEQLLTYVLRDWTESLFAHQVLVFILALSFWMGAVWEARRQWSVPMTG
jgi:drug/metabolite transporter (DMT)-like permease